MGIPDHTDDRPFHHSAFTFSGKGYSMFGMIQG
jgi:hypothetical protein